MEALGSSRVYIYVRTGRLLARSAKLVERTLNRDRKDGAKLADRWRRNENNALWMKTILYHP